VDEGIVEGSQDVADSKSVFGLLSSANNRGAVISNLFFLNFSVFFSFGGSTFLCSFL
jgi:hypothetical protein